MILAYPYCAHFCRVKLVCPQKPEDLLRNETFVFSGGTPSPDNFSDTVAN
jgi:hypothetical protein